MHLKILKKERGFTLIEVLVVVMVIAVLGGIVLSLINSAGIRQKARDSQRIADLKKIQAALELFFADQRRYPVTTGGGWELVSTSSGTSQLVTRLTGTYLAQVPTDPLPGGTDISPCGSTTPRYNYRSDNNGYRYVLTAVMEVATSDDASLCSSLPNWTTGLNCIGTLANCYGVQNP